MDFEVLLFLFFLIGITGFIVGFIIWWNCPFIRLEYREWLNTRKEAVDKLKKGD